MPCTSSAVIDVQRCGSSDQITVVHVIGRVVYEKECADKNSYVRDLRHSLDAFQSISKKIRAQKLCMRKGK